MYKFFVGDDITSFEDNGKQLPISRVTLKVDDESVLTAGDDTGMELLADCPHATQAMVNAILAQVKGYRYQMFSAGDAGLDPAAELGDGITVGGVYSVISRLSDDGSGFPSVTAPGEAELEDEYPAGGPMSREFNRKIAETRSSITKTADQIRLEVSNEVKGLSSSIDVKLNSIALRVQGAEGNISTLTQTANAITTEISYMDRDISRIEQKVDNIRLEVSNGESSSWIDLTVNGITLSSQQVKFTGDVVFEDDLQRGTTTISGDCIRTGEISANYIHLGGKMECFESATSDYVGGYIGYMEGLAASGDTTSGIGISSKYDDSQVLCTSNGARMTHMGRTSVTCTYSRVSLTGPEIVVNGTLKSSDGTVITSDRTLKEDIRADADAYLDLFDRLQPVSFRLKGRTRRHLGFIAQDVEAAMEETGIKSGAFAALVRDGTGLYGLRYEEFVPLLAAKLQRLEKMIKEMQK